jgi:hypothetical protein
MSKIALSGDPSGTGTFTIASPNSNSNFTLTLPAATGTVLTSATTTGFPAGSVLQVVSTNSTASSTTTGNFPQNSGITQAITPSSASSKILVFASISSSADGSGTNANKIGIYGIKNNTSATTLGVRRVGANLSAGGSDWFGETTLVFLDSPGSTSAQTYEILFGRINATFDCGVAINTGVTGASTTLTLMEIAA